jgi:signal-transduction protein with cAMP-binding, CBS, and nucleotidyltransferase domain
MKVAQDLIKDKNREIVSTPADTTIADAAILMRRENVGSLLVTENDAIVGIWTERDLVRDAAEKDFDIHSAQIGSYMSNPLITCEWNDSVYSLMDKYLGLHIRHLVVNKDGQHIGLLSARDVMRATIHEKDRELGELNASMGWQYYEEWKHK